MQKFDREYYNLFGHNVSLLESVNIIKYLNNNLENYHHLPILKDFSCDGYEDDDIGQNTIIDFEGYVMDYFDNLEKYIFESFKESFSNFYEEIKRIIRAIAIYTNSDINKIMNNFKSLLIESKQDTTYDELDDILDEHNEIEKLLRKQGAKNIQIYTSYDGCETLVRYEFPKSNNTYELIEKSFAIVKEELIEYVLVIAKKDIETNLANVTKDYQIIGTDAQLTEDEKRDALYNTFNNIEKSLTTIHQDSFTDIMSLNQMKDSITNALNQIRGDTRTRHYTELLILMRKSGLNQISRNEKGQYHYVGLFKILVDYYDLLGGFKANLENLKYLDDTLTNSRNKLLNINGIKSYRMNKWYDFYKIAKNKYKKKNLYSVYFSYLHNTKSITLKMFKKIFKVAKLQEDTINIYHLPPLHT